MQVDAVGLIAQMLRRIPAAMRKIEPADERNGIVYNDDFLVMRTADGMLGVPSESSDAVADACANRACRAVSTRDYRQRQIRSPTTTRTCAGRADA